MPRVFECPPSLILQVDINSSAGLFVEPTGEVSLPDHEAKRIRISLISRLAVRIGSIYRTGRNVGPTVRTVRLAGSVSPGASAIGAGCGAAGVFARGSGRLGLPSAPMRGCDNCLAFCSVTMTSPGATVSSVPLTLSASAQLSPGRRQLHAVLSALR